MGDFRPIFQSALKGSKTFFYIRASEKKVLKGQELLVMCCLRIKKREKHRGLQVKGFNGSVSRKSKFDTEWYPLWAL